MNRTPHTEARSGTIGGNAVNSVETVTTTGNTAAQNTISDIPYSGGAQFIYFKITQANEDGSPDRAWTAPIWFDVSQAQPPGSPPPSTEDASKFVASKNSLVYHVSSDCRSAKAIKESNRITGAAAKQGRTPHQGCPIP